MLKEAFFEGLAGGYGRKKQRSAAFQKPFTAERKFLDTLLNIKMKKDEER